MNINNSIMELTKEHLDEYVDYIYNELKGSKLFTFLEVYIYLYTVYKLYI